MQSTSETVRSTPSLLKSPGFLGFLTEQATYSIPLTLGIATLLHLLTGITFLSAQTVGPESIIRATTISGSALEASAAFEPDATYVAWRDTRAEGSSGGDIYVQKLGADGHPRWATNGLAICVATNSQSLPAITPDGTGGAVVSWLDDRTNLSAIYSQRISAAGTPQWAVDGVLVGIVYLEQPYSFVHRASDGGFLITWWDSAPLVGTDRLPVLAQKLDANGARLWDPGDPDTQDYWGSGIEVINGITRGRSAPDGTGGFVAIGKIRNDGGFRFQRVRADSSAVWPAPVDFPVALPDTVAFNFAPDGAGGVILAYLDNRDMKAFRIAGDGSFPWGTTGILLQTNVITGQLPFVLPNGTGGSFISWVASTPHDVRVQQIASDGTPLWAPGGAVVPDGSSTEREPALIRDGSGGLFLSFTTATSLRGQRLDQNGAAQWKPNGSNGVGLGSGELPIIGVRDSGPIVVFKRSAGLIARSIAVPSPLRVTSITPLAHNQVQLSFGGGVAGRTYDVLRSANVTPAPNTWTTVGTVQSGQNWTDENPLSSQAFYLLRDPSP